MLISVGELNKNKNNRVIISALEKLHQKNIHYVLCDIGDQEVLLKAQVKAAGLQNNVHFLGYRTDVKELYEMADCFVMPSYREGLSRSIMEAMASGLPCIVSKIRGNVDLIKNDKGGFLCGVQDAAEYAHVIKTLVTYPETQSKFGSVNLHNISKYDMSFTTDIVEGIYSGI